jgi:hypothetical protein
MISSGADRRRLLLPWPSLSSCIEIDERPSAQVRDFQSFFCRSQRSDPGEHGWPGSRNVFGAASGSLATGRDLLVEARLPSAGPKLAANVFNGALELIEALLDARSTGFAGRTATTTR